MSIEGIEIDNAILNGGADDARDDSSVGERDDLSLADLPNDTASTNDSLGALPPVSNNSKKKIWVFASVASFSLLALVVGLGVGLGTKNENGTKSTTVNEIQSCVEEATTTLVPLADVDPILNKPDTIGSQQELNSVSNDYSKEDGSEEWKKLFDGQSNDVRDNGDSGSGRRELRGKASHERAIQSVPRGLGPFDDYFHRKLELPAPNHCHTRIIGGAQSKNGDFPYMVSLHVGSRGHSCGGTLISETVVLTAAHCGGRTLDKAFIRGDSKKIDEGEEVKIVSQLPHPDYNPRNLNNDIMLVFLEEPVSDVEFVKLNSDDSSPDDGDPVAAVGWGVTDVTSPSISDVLKEVHMNAISNEECNESEGDVVIGGQTSTFSYEGRISDVMVCAMEDGEGSCQGDSGGPLLLKEGSNFSQIGIVSWGFGCALKDFPGVYARVSPHFDWISKEVCESQYPNGDFDCDGITPMPSTQPSASIKPSVSTSPSTSNSGCEDTPGWEDYDGDGCDWYERNDLPGCYLFGSFFVGSMGSAAENCCHCQSG